jgi:hypothetical protein
MPQDNITFFVKLKFTEVYAPTVKLTVRQFRIVLLIFAASAVLGSAVLLMALVRSRPGVDWYEMIPQLRPLLWVLVGLGFVVFVAPAIRVWKLLQDPRVKGGYRYSFSEAGMELETSSTRANVNWTGLSAPRNRVPRSFCSAPKLSRTACQSAASRMNPRST